MSNPLYPVTTTVLAVAAALLLNTSAAVAQSNPADAENARLAARTIELGRDPRGAVPLLELWDNWDKSTPQKLVAELSRLAKHPALDPARKVLVESMLAQSRLRLGDANAVGKRFDELGYVTRFRVIGPFDNEGKRGFDQETPIEQKRTEAPDLQATYPGRERPVAWRELPEIVRSGFVPFGAVLRPFENVCGLAETFVKSDRARQLGLWSARAARSRCTGTVRWCCAMRPTAARARIAARCWCRLRPDGIACSSRLARPAARGAFSCASRTRRVASRVGSSTR